MQLQLKNVHSQKMALKNQCRFGMNAALCTYSRQKLHESFKSFSLVFRTLLAYQRYFQNVHRQLFIKIYFKMNLKQEVRMADRNEAFPPISRGINGFEEPIPSREKPWIKSVIKYSVATSTSIGVG